MKKKPPAFAAYTGMTGKPTTFSFVRPGPGYWVLLDEDQTDVGREQPDQDRRQQEDVHAVQPRDDHLAGERAAEDAVHEVGADHRGGLHRRPWPGLVPEQVVGEE